MTHLFLWVYEYYFDEQGQDEEFLAGKDVKARAVMRTGSIPLKGNEILVRLTNGKKYKGTVVDFHHFDIRNVSAGDLVIRRLIPGNS